MSFNIVLYEPEIPQNTGNIGRLCVNSGSRLHIVGKPAFDLSEKAVRRAGLDYWKDLDLSLYDDWNHFKSSLPGDIRIFLVSKYGQRIYYKQYYQIGDYFLFGSETSGIPEKMRKQFKDEATALIPMQQGRSLNLSNSVSIVLYEAIRQTGILEK